jgi:hypothetical protein
MPGDWLWMGIFKAPPRGTYYFITETGVGYRLVAED